MLLKLIKRTVVIVTINIFLVACQSTKEANSNAAVSAQPFDKQNVSNIINSTPKLNLDEDDWGTDIAYLDSVYYSIASQMAALATNPKYFTMPITLTKEMYDVNHQRFYMVLDSRWLKSVGAINSDLEVSVLSTNNMWNSHISRNMELATYNRNILSAIALAGVKNNKPTKKQKKLMSGPNLDAVANQYSVLSGSTKFSKDKAKNLDYLYGFLSLHKNTNAKAFNPGDYFGRVRQKTQRAVFYMDVAGDVAKSWVGKTVELIFMPISAFKVAKTGQYVVIADANHSALRLSGSGAMQGNLASYYYWNGIDFSKKFTMRRTRDWVSKDEETGVYCNRSCK